MQQFFSRLFIKFKLMDKTTKVIFIAFLVLSFVTFVLAFNFARSFIAGMTILKLPGAPVASENQTNTQGETANPQVQLNEPTAQPWNGVSRVTILLLGLDYRDWQAKETPRSDTMILLTIDPVTKSAGMVSIPRDLWVNIPNFKFAKINEAFYLGEINHLPGGGPALATETIEQFLGVPINFYAQIDFGAFIKFINTIGGVVISPEYDVTVEAFGSRYEQVLKAGQYYTLPGDLALSYARDRYSGQQGDVDRAKRQQQVVIAIRNRILKYDSLPNLVAKAPIIYQELSSGIHTNISLMQGIQLGTLALQIAPEKIKKGVINFDMMIPSTSPDGLSILIPVMDKIRVLRDEIFSTGGAAAPIASPNANSTLVRDEAAKVAIQNGTAIAGLADKTAAYFQSQGINIVEKKNAPEQYSGSLIYVYNPKPYTLAYIADLMKVAPTNIWNKFDPNVGVDLIVVLGNDWATNNQLP